VKLAVEEVESEALLAALEGRGPYVTSVVGEIETVRACRRVNVPAAQVEELQEGLVILAVDDDVRRLAGAITPPTLRTLDAIHLATALALHDDVDGFVTYDARLARAAGEAGLAVFTPS
jgi:predicted nucleic acid-binding protein